MATMLPRERQFFVLFRQAAETLRQSLQSLNTLLHLESGDFRPEARRLRDLEHQADEITHHIIHQLNATFITPFDREDIYALASSLDDIVDLAEETADTIIIDRIAVVTPYAQQQGDLLVQIGEELVAAIGQLEGRQNMTQHWVRIHELENEGDRITRRAIGSLFDSNDPIHIIKWKDVYSLLEKTIDTAEDVANILESVTLKNT